jgi:nitrate reductase gamma subunit
MSETLHFVEHRLQEIALCWMATIYIIRIWWFTRFKASNERQSPTGKGTVKPTASIIYSLANIAMPWGMESTRQRWFMYLQFVVFHLGVAGAIGLSFIIPYAPQLLESQGSVIIFRLIIGGGFVVGTMRIIHRISDRYMRAISTPDDYFSLFLLTVFFFFAFLAVPNDLSKGETIMMTYFCLTAFFLVYVPFSKISHYLYYPFTRYYLGRTMGRRGVFPLTQSSTTK